MHCPDGMGGEEYIGLVAAVSILLSRNLDARETFILGDFLDAVSDQLITLAAFKDWSKRPPPVPPAKQFPAADVLRSEPPRRHPPASAG